MFASLTGSGGLIMDIQNYQEYLDEILIEEKDLRMRIAEVGQKISRDYQGESIHLICRWPGGILFLTDISRKITGPNTIDFIVVSSYGTARNTTGQGRITLDLQEDFQGRNFLLVEDIIDSGYTIASVLEFLETRHPASLRVCALLNKPERREVEVPIDYCGFIIPNKFVFGYGLDMDEYYRNLPFIATVNLDRYQPPDDAG